jgi:hypothetical protein
MKKINNITMVVTKILEIFHWMGTGLATVFFFVSIFARDWFCGILSTGTAEYKSLTTYGFEVIAVNSLNEINMTAVSMFFGVAILILGLMAMVFRNIHLIIKKSKTISPFNKDNIRMLREIGIFSIAIPVLELIMSVVFGLVFGHGGAELAATVDLTGIIMGIIVFSLTNIFSYGAKLENDVEGLL